MSASGVRSKIGQVMLRAAAPSSICVALALITLGIFAQTFAFKFLNFDDNLFVYENPRLTQGLSANGLAWAFTANLTHDDVNAEYWEPLTLLSRLADVQFSGLDAGAHHRTNVLLHLAAGLVLFGALRVLLRSDWRSGLIAALFLIHPLHVEPVAWLSARKDILNAVFFFGTIWAYAWYAARPSRRRFALVCLIFLFANMAKPMAVSLPFVLLLLDFWPLGRLGWPLLPRAAVRLFLEKIPLILIAVVVAILAILDQDRHGAIGDDVLYPLSVRLGSAAIGYCAYLVQTFVPTNLAILYPHPGTGLSWPLAAASGACLLLVTGLCILNAKRRPWLLVGWSWFIVVLLPVSGVVQIGEMARADRYTYVSLVGIFLLCVQQISEWFGHPMFHRARWRTACLVAFTSLILGVFAIVSWEQTKTWSDSISVFRQALAVTSDNYIAEANLGSALVDAGRKEEGFAHFTEAIRLHAPALEHHRRTAIEAERRHELPTAIQHYGKILTLVPWDADVHQRLGSVLLQNGDYAKALVQYNEALRYDRNAIPPRLGVATVLIALQRFAEARGLLNAVLRQEAGNEEAAALLRTLPSEPPK
jgi:tetratricopeptide (TPR) repeat protein